MKIAIFGDSFADDIMHKEQGYDTWVEILRKKYYPDLVCYGTCGSSLYYSYNLLKKHYQDYDKIIFIATGPGRMSLPDYIEEPKHPFLFSRLRHFAGIRNIELTLKESDKFNFSPVVIQALEAAVMYYKYLYDDNKEQIMHKLLIEDISRTLPDVLFLDSQQLVNISKYEIQACGLSFPYLNENFFDRRRCHLTKRNNEILAEKMHQWIEGTPISLLTTDFEAHAREEIERLFGMEKK